MRTADTVAAPAGACAFAAKAIRLDCGCMDDQRDAEVIEVMNRQIDGATLWAPRRQLTLDQARRRSAHVKLLRYALVGCAAAAIGLFLGFVLRSAIIQETGPVRVNEDEVVTMVNPRFTGRDGAGDIFTITAEAATLRRTDRAAVDLSAPILRDSEGAELTAPSGFYDRDAGILELYDDVRIRNDAGYSFVAQGARVHVKEGRIEGLSPLEGKGPMGDIRADSYRVLDGGKRVIFEGNVRTVIYPQSSPEPPRDESEPDETP